MASDFVFIFFLFVFVLFNKCNGEDDAIVSKQQSSRSGIYRCEENLRILWQTEIGHSPFASEPLVADVNGDGLADIIAAPFSEAITILEGENGKTLANSQWPTQNLEGSIHARPLQYDIDGDGRLDILLILSSGDMKFFEFDGTPMLKYGFQLPVVYVLKQWHDKVQFAAHDTIHQYIADDITKTKAYIPIDPQVLATPVLADLNRDGRVEELVIPITYFLGDDTNRDQERSDQLKDISPEKYLVSGLTIFNLTSLQPITQIYLELTQVHAQLPAYVLSPPTVVDLDSEGSSLEIVIGTSTGNLHVLNMFGKERAGFPKQFRSLIGPITVQKLKGDGHLQLVSVDSTGNVVCTDKDGHTLWERELAGSPSEGTTAVDVDQDGILDIVIATNNGSVYALNGTSGVVLPKWPLHVGSRVVGNILVSKTIDGHIEMVFTADDANLYVIAQNQICKSQLLIGETSLVGLISHDLVSSASGEELLVSTNDGSLFCLGNTDQGFHQVNDHIVRSIDHMPNIFIHLRTRTLTEVTGSWFVLEYDIIDNSATTDTSYSIGVYYGRNLLIQEKQIQPGSYSLNVPVWEIPSWGHVTVLLTNQHGQTSSDSFPIKFNKLILKDLQWLVLAPFVAMVIILLINHGFPAKDLLPVAFMSKSK